MLIIALNLYHPFVEAESTVLIFFIFWPSKIRINPTGIVSSLSPPWCRLSSGRCCYTAAPCHASFPWSQDELTASTLSSGNALSYRLTSRAESEALNLDHRCRPPSLDHPTTTLYCYKKVISTLVTLLTTQLRLHFTSSLAGAPHHRSSTRHRCSLSLSSHAHRPSAKQHPR
jgi:hypothetical protein